MIVFIEFCLFLVVVVLNVICFLELLFCDCMGDRILGLFIEFFGVCKYCIGEIFLLILWFFFDRFKIDFLFNCFFFINFLSNVFFINVKRVKNIMLSMIKI